MKLCGHPKIDVERELSFLKMFVTMMLRFPFHLLLIVVSRFFSAVLRFSFFRSGLVQTTVMLQKPFALTREIIATKISR